MPIPKVQHFLPPPCSCCHPPPSHQGKRACERSTWPGQGTMWLSPTPTFKSENIFLKGEKLRLVSDLKKNYNRNSDLSSRTQNLHHDNIHYDPYSLSNGLLWRKNSDPWNFSLLTTQRYATGPRETCEIRTIFTLWICNCKITLLKRETLPCIVYCFHLCLKST